MRVPGLMRLSMHSSPMSCRIITGGKGEGKTTALGRIASSISSPHGFLSLHEGDEYYLLNLDDGSQRLLMTASPLFTEIIGRWSYDAALFKEASAELIKIDSGSVFIDEIGRLELDGKGFAPALSALAEKPVDLYISVRRDFLQEVIEKFNLQEAEIREAAEFL